MVERLSLWSRIVILAAMMLNPIAGAAQTSDPARVGFLMSGPPSSHAPFLEALREGLRTLGYVEGRTIILEPRFAMGNRALLPKLARELIGMRPDVIVVTGSTAAKMTRKESPTVPIVVAITGDLVGSGLVASLARPGGRTTGMTGITEDLSAKKLQLLKETVPRLSRVAVLHDHSNNFNRAALQRIVGASGPMGVTVRGVSIEAPRAFEGALADITKDRPDALIVLVNRYTSVRRKEIVAFVVKRKLPTMCWAPALARLGCLMSYGADRLDMVRRSASHVHRILNGADPGELPVEQPTKFELAVNLRTAKTLGIEIPPSILLRATMVIE